METDSTLLHAARRMDKEALGKIFDLYSPLLYKYALRLCGDPVLADHIVGDVFAKLLDQLAAGKGPTSNLRSYLYETAYHRMIDEKRFSNRRAPLEEALGLGSEKQPWRLSVEDEILVKQILRALQTRLTDDQRHVIVLRFLEEFSLRETAAILGKRKDHIKVIQSRALAALRKTLEYHGLRKATSLPLARKIPQSIGV